MDNVEKAKRLLFNKEQTPLLKHIIIMDNDSLTQFESNNLDGIIIHQFEDLLKNNATNIIPDLLPEPDDTYIIW